jgi:hypothetical protein
VRVKGVVDNQQAVCGRRLSKQGQRHYSLPLSESASCGAHSGCNLQRQ